ncbi:MAG: hypothetical protein IIU49_04440 [Spirochaetales bacterium]|nr:hypothetical protein [Spirochaetales bacterium]
MANTVKDMKAVFAEMAERLNKQYPKKEEPAQTISAQVVQTVAGQMAKRGYEMSQKAIEIVTDYLKGYNLWLCGSVGVGKTYFFDIMSKVRVEEKGLPPIVKLSMIETMGWTMDQAREWVMDNKGDDVLLDDVGSEPLMNSYGVKAELFPYLLEKRMQVTTKRTHITSNLGAKDIIERYDVRVSDRFAQMFKYERFADRKSMRKTRPWKAPRQGAGML